MNLHVFTQLEMSERIGLFERDYVTEYDPDAVNVSAHYSGPRSLPALATVYHYPATADVTPPSAEEVSGHFERLMSDVGRASPGAELIGTHIVRFEVNGFDLRGAHARFSLTDHPTFAGPVDSHLFLFSLDGWYLKFRFSHPMEIADDVIPLEAEFISATKWPIPEESATEADAP